MEFTSITILGSVTKFLVGLYFLKTHPQRNKYSFNGNFGQVVTELCLLPYRLHDLIDSVRLDAITAVLAIILIIRVGR